MSCGNPHETSCAEVIEAVYLFLDGEIDEAHQEKIKTHLDECSPCLAQYGIEQEVKALVHRCCGSERASADLRAHVLARLATVRTELGAEPSGGGSLGLTLD